MTIVNFVRAIVGVDARIIKDSFRSTRFVKHGVRGRIKRCVRLRTSSLKKPYVSPLFSDSCVRAYACLSSPEINCIQMLVYLDNLFCRIGNTAGDVRQDFVIFPELRVCTTS